LHDAYLKSLRRSGGKVVVGAPVERIVREDVWRIDTPAGTFRAPVVVNAAGAWADDIARLAGLPAIGLVPKRRTALIVAAPNDPYFQDWPVANDIAEILYFKPDAGKLLVSPADETPVAPCDVQPEEIDIAVAIDRLEQATTINVRRVERKWAGLRSFVSDKSPVVGFDPLAEGFFWLAGQGGVGIQTSYAMARCAHHLVCKQALPDDIVRLGLRAAELGPARFR
jgi:D-arginine dehydrogenase